MNCFILHNTLINSIFTINLRMESFRHLLRYFDSIVGFFHYGVDVRVDSMFDSCYLFIQLPVYFPKPFL